MILFSDLKMEDHIKHINKFCRLCRKDVTTAVYKVANTVNFCSRKDQIDINSDDERTQSKVTCQVCYKNLKKCEEEMKYLKKNPNSSRKFAYTMPEYAENVNVHTGVFCKCREGLAQETRHDDAEFDFEVIRKGFFPWVEGKSISS